MNDLERHRKEVVNPILHMRVMKDAYVMFKNKSIQVDRFSFSQMVQTLVLVKNGLYPTETITWRCADNTYLDISPSELWELIKISQEKISSLNKKLWDYRDATFKAQTKEELISIIDE